MDYRTFTYRNNKGEVITSAYEKIQEDFRRAEITGETLVTWGGFPHQVPFSKIDVKYFVISAGRLYTLSSDTELIDLSTESFFQPDAFVYSRDLPGHGITFSQLRLIDIKFEPNIEQFAQLTYGKALTVLAGPNNSGKTLLLKFLRKELGLNTTYLASNRFYHFDTISLLGQENERLKLLQKHESYLNQLFTAQQNLEQSDYQIQETVSRLSNKNRETLWMICTELLGEDFSVKHEDPENDYSRSFVAIGDKNLSLASTGTRLLVVTIAACLDSNTQFLLIDEPEIGLSPSLQTILANFLYGEDSKAKYFPHVKQIYIATHSHIFLDKLDIKNNYIITKHGDTVNISQVVGMQNFHDLHFNLLGNELTSLFLPNCIVIVEGESDHIFIKRLCDLHFTGKGISVIKSKGDGDAERQLNTLIDVFGDLSKSPYSERIFVMLDERHTSRVGNFQKKGMPRDRVIELENNGIEYYYPAKILAEIFKCGKNPHQQLNIQGNIVKINDIEYTKRKLAEEVTYRLDSSMMIDPELSKKIFDPIRELID